MTEKRNVFSGLLLELSHGDEMCWCDHGIGNPMAQGHSDLCRRIQKAFDEEMDNYLRSERARREQAEALK